MARGLLRAVLVTTFLIAVPAQAQISQKGFDPPSLDNAKSQWLGSSIPIETMPTVDVQALQAEDVLNAGRKDIPWRFGKNIPVDIDPSRHGVWDRLPDGSRVWRLAIRSPGALSINLTFDQYNLPPGAQLFVHNPARNTVLGAFTDFNNQAAGSFATTLVPGEQVILEYYEPVNVRFGGALHLETVTHGYRDAFTYAADKAFGQSGNCNNNTVCPVSAGWEDQIRSAVMLVSGGNGFCSGALINNTNNDGTPYVLTANHCGCNPTNWVFHFNWESPTCQNPGSSPPFDSMSGAVRRASRANSDFCLVEINNAVPQGYDAYWSGWDNTGAIPTSTVGIHHPSGDIKKFSVDNDPADVSGYFGAGDDHWRVNDWDDGTTEPGSSGSPLFDQNQRIIGQLHGGSAACGNNLEDYYGRFFTSWDGANASSRLSDWLDPAGLGVGVLDGYPTGQVFALDAALQSIDSPIEGSATCEAEVSPVVTIWNRGSDTLTSLDITYTIDGGAPANYAWSGSLANNQVETVTLPVLTPGPGIHALDIALVNPNGGVDENPGNDGGSVNFELIDANGVALPITEGFEGNTFPPSGWILDNPDDQVAWERTTAVGGFGNSAAAAWFNNYDDDFRFEADSLISPIVNLVGNATLQFDVAYGRYSPNLFDRMDVSVSTDCGQTWTQVWSKEDSELSTTGQDEADPFVPAADQWRTETVDLSAYAGQPTVQVALTNVTGYGNNLYLDNINLAYGDGDGDGDGYTVGDGDCDDTDPDVNPGEVETTCDNIDNDCNGATEDDPDGDADGVGVCSDCDDADSNNFPGNVELCDGADNDCDGSAAGDEGDSDGDGAIDCDDNCVNDANADQADEDNDGVGNVCDADYDPGDEAGGCCSAAGSTPDGGMLLLFGFVALMLLRRRRRSLV